MNRFAHLVVACACSVSSLAAQWGWSLRTSPTVPPLGGGQLAYDLHRGVTVMFGYASDTWEWNGSDWTLRNAPGPSPRGSPAFGYDLARMRIVMFGGLSHFDGTPLFDTWEFDGTHWRTFAVSGPSARSYSALAWDPNGIRMLLFGGQLATGVSADTWSWNGATWQQLTPQHAPGPRSSFGLATDFYGQRIVLHGGLTFPGGQVIALSDTWTWNGSDWNQVVTATDPGPRRSFGMAFDWSQGVMVRFGGFEAGVVDHEDTWLFDHDNWIRDQAAMGPAPRGAGIAYDVARGKVVMFGGDGWTTLFSDTWEYTVPPFASWVPYGGGCAGTAGVPRLAALPAQRPVVGGRLGLELSGVPDGPVVFATGFSTTTWSGVPLPAPLDAIGMPSCTAYGSVERCDLATAVLGRATLSLPVPNVLSLIGITFVNQAFAADPGFNAFGGVVSNAGIGKIGAL